MKVMEIFNQGYDWKWLTQGLRAKEAEFVTDDNSTVVVRFESFVEGVWKMQFNRTDPQTGQSTLTLTGTGDAFKILATVRDIVADFISNTEDVDTLLTAVDKTEMSRYGVYKQMFTKNKPPGWDVIGTEGNDYTYVGMKKANNV